MFGNKVYELPLARDYVSRWGVTEGIRELLQNAIDSPAPFEVKQSGDSLTITSRGVKLDPATLVLGRTSKSDDAGAIGQFGEGYKLALLVLTREGKTVDVINGRMVWRPDFRTSAQFGIETLHIIESRGDENFDGVQFFVRGLSGDDQAAIKSSCLLMQDLYPDTIMTPHGDILPNLPGKLYVGGLYVCDTELNFGYNLNPGEIELERDRQTVANFDLRWKTRDVWLSTMQYDRIAELIERDMPDVNMVEFGSPELLKEACYRHFKTNHPDKVIAKDQEELDELVKRGMTVYVSPSRSYYKTVTSSRSYQKDVSVVPQQTPVEALTEWYNENKKYMPRIPATSFKRLLQRAEKWRIG
jgi:hypothetical protein